MKNVKTVLLILSVIFILSGCTEKGQSSGCDLFDDCGETAVESQDMNFKEKYEALNGLENSSGKIHRVLSIPEEHPFKVTEPKTVIDKFVKGETFYLYIGDEACPWCRANIEKAIEISKKAGIDEIFYLEIILPGYSENGFLALHLMEASDLFRHLGKSHSRREDNGQKQY